MNLGELVQEIKEVRRDPTIENSIVTWINQAMTELTGQYELPTLRLRVPATLVTTTANYLYDLSAATHVSGYLYQKRLMRVTSPTVQQGFWLEPDMNWLEDIDASHSSVGDAVQRVAVDADTVMVFPKANDTLSLWFYRKPAVMVNNSDIPDGIPEPYHYRVLVPYVVLRSFRQYPDDLPYGVMGDGTKSLAYWTAQLNAGLYGNSVQEGMLHYIQKAQRVGTPRVKGAPRGSNLGGNYRGSW